MGKYKHTKTTYCLRMSEVIGFKSSEYYHTEIDTSHYPAVVTYYAAYYAPGYYTNDPSQTFYDLLYIIYGFPGGGNTLYPQDKWKELILDKEDVKELSNYLLWKINDIKVISITDAQMNEFFPIEGDNTMWTYSDNHIQTNNNLQMFVDKFTFWFLSKIQYYYKRVQILDETEGKGILGKVYSNGKTASRFNDTPDGISKEENYYQDDKWATSTRSAISENETDFDTPAGRMREALDALPQIAEEFYNDFEREFAIYEW